MKKEKLKLYKELFFSTLYLSAFTFGGGYVIVTMMKERFCDELHYIDEKEVLNLIAIAQSAPGAIAVNGAIVLGYKMAGLMGVLICVVGTVIPPFAIIYVISMFYHSFISNAVIRSLLTGMRAGVGALICSVVYDMGKGVVADSRYVSVFIMAATFILNYFLKVNIGLIVLGCIGLGICDTLYHRKKARK